MCLFSVRKVSKREFSFFLWTHSWFWTSEATVIYNLFTALENNAVGHFSPIFHPQALKHCFSFHTTDCRFSLFQRLIVKSYSVSHESIVSCTCWVAETHHVLLGGCGFVTWSQLGRQTGGMVRIKKIKGKLLLFPLSMLCFTSVSPLSQLFLPLCVSAGKMVWVSVHSFIDTVQNSLTMASCARWASSCLTLTCETEAARPCTSIFVSTRLKCPIKTRLSSQRYIRMLLSA